MVAAVAEPVARKAHRQRKTLAAAAALEGNERQQILKGSQRKRPRDAASDGLQQALPQRAKRDFAVAPPRWWQRDYEMICELRSDRTAVVDRMGSEAIAVSACKADRAYQILISLMLSSQTKCAHTRTQHVRTLLSAR
jgi:hypothetical protein